MLKMLFVFLSSFIAGKYQEIASATEESIRDARGGYVLFEEAGILCLRDEKASWVVQLPEASEHLSALKNGNYLFLYRTDAAWEVQEFDFSGKLLRSEVLIKNPLLLKDAVYTDALYLSGSITVYQEDFLLERRENRAGEDAIILCFDEDYGLRDVRIYGGYLNESICKLVPAEGCFYAVGRKDPESGGDFGNGGRQANSVFVARLSENLELEDYEILACSATPLAFVHHKDALYLALPDRLYKFDSDLNVLLKKRFEKNYRGARITSYDKLLFFGEEEVEIVDILDFGSETLSSQYLREDAEIGIFPDAIIVDGFRYDLASLEDFVVFERHVPEIESPKTVRTVFGEAEFLEELSEPHFDPQVHGEYLKEFRFRSASEIFFSVFRKVEVPLRANVSEGGIYPCGYRLQFTGHGELDGKTVLNNHVLDREGSRRLILTDNSGKKTEINFTVSKAQTEFRETVATVWDFEAEAGEPFFLELPLSGIGERIIKSVVVNGEEIRDLLYDPAAGVLTIPLEENVPGIKHYYFERLLYFEDGKLLNLPLRQLVTVNLLEQAPRISMLEISPLVFEAEVESGGTLRCLEVIALNATGEVRKIHPLGTVNIHLELEKGEYDFEISLLYDPGNKKLEALPLFSGKIKGEGTVKIGEINIVRKHESLEKFRIGLEKGVTLSAEKNEQGKEVSKTIRNLVCGGLAGAVCFSGSLLFAKLGKRKKKSA